VGIADAVHMPKLVAPDVWNWTIRADWGAHITALLALRSLLLILDEMIFIRTCPFGLQ